MAEGGEGMEGERGQQLALPCLYLSLFPSSAAPCTCSAWLRYWSEKGVDRVYSPGRGTKVAALPLLFFLVVFHGFRVIWKLRRCVCVSCVVVVMKSYLRRVFWRFS